jgi:hypothetical protein
MKTITTFLTIILLLGLFALDTCAQDEKKNQLLVVWENSVIPAQAKQYEEAVKKQVALMEKYTHVIPYYVYSTDDYFYYWITLIDNFAAFEDLSAKWFAFNAEVQKNDGFYHGQEFKGTTNYVLPQIYNHRPEMSYVPANLTFNPKETQYFRFGYCYGKRGFEKEFEDNWKQWVALFNKYNITIGWNMYEGILGTETPFYLWSETYKNEVDLASNRAKAFEVMGEESNKLWQETEHLLRKIEYKTGWYRPELSYIPQN